MQQPFTLPYFDRLLLQLAKEDAHITTAFGKHVHWGYFADPDMEHVTAADYGHAAEALCLKMLDLAEVADGQRILDVGCGFGGTLSCLNARLSGAELFGLNIDLKQLHQAAEHVVTRPNNRVHFITANAAELPLADDSIDLMLCVESVFHFDRPRFFAEVSRVLRQGGSLTLSDFVPDQRTAEFLNSMNLGEDEAIRSAYGSIEINWPLDRYEHLAASLGLSLTESVDISSHTLPTYKFLQDCVASWKEETEARLFARATSLLEKATRRGFIGYQLVRFEKR